MLAYDRPQAQHQANGEELRYRFDKGSTDRGSKPSHLASYTKGLPHDGKDGLICDPTDYQQFIRGIDSGDTRDFQDTPLGPKGSEGSDTIEWKSQYTQNCNVKVRAWESAGAGLLFDLEGPDCQSITMPPAPTLDSDETVAEVAEVYEMSLLRDVPFSEFESNPNVAAAVDRLNNLPWFQQTVLPLTAAAGARRRLPLTPQTASEAMLLATSQAPISRSSYREVRPNLAATKMAF